MATNAFNGTNVFIRVNNGSSWLSVGGQTSHTETLTNGLIDAGSKDSGDYRELLPDEGILEVAYSIEVLFVSQAAYEFVRSLAVNQSKALFQVLFTDEAGDFVSIEITLLVQSFVDNSENGTPFSGTITLLSNDAFEFGGEINFSDFCTASLEPFKTVSGEQFVVRVPA